MFYLDYSDTAVKIGPKNLRKISYQSSDELVRLLSPLIRGSRVAVLIPESDIFLQRTRLIAPTTDISEVRRLIIESTPLKDDEIIFSYRYIPQTKEVLTFAMNIDIYKTYLNLMKSCRATPESFIPQSALVFEALRKKISSTETILFIDIGPLSSELIVLDIYGPIYAFEEDIHEKNLLAGLPRILTHIKKKYGREVARIVLSGEGVHILQDKHREFPLPTTLASDYILAPHTYSDDVLSYFNILTLDKSYAALQSSNLLQASPENSSPSMGKNILGIGAGLIILGTIVFVIGKEMQLRNTTSISPVSSQVPSPAPSPTPLPPTLSVISFEVLNGSGIEGQAGKVADLLKGNGVTQVTTANAEEYTYVKTVIRIKKEYASFGPELESLIGSAFEIDPTEILDTTASAGIQIIVGR